MRRLASVMGGLVISLAACGAARADFLNWGMEASKCGNNTFNIIAGSGKDIYLNSLSGVISVAFSSNSTVIDNTVERQVLIAIAGNTPFAGKVTGNPSQTGYNHEVNRGLFVTSVKQVGSSVAHVPFEVTFPKPVLIPGGALLANFAIASSNTQYNPSSGICLDAEAHVEVIWQSTP